MKKIMLLLCAAFALSSATAQNPMMNPLPTDKALRTGTLENGMRYYIRHNEKPKGQADFYIWHNIGAIQEDDSQQGLAHFLEHMAFNGTKNLPGKQLTEYLETVGVKFGANLNAYTTWDQTCYNISDVPTSRQGIIDTALLILHDWSHFIALEPKEIDSERGVIMEELRTRDNAGWRSTIKQIKAIGKGTPYENRNLIGYLDDLKSFDHAELEAFYQKWYRPEYQAVVVVGDIDVDAVEAQLKTLMADIPASPADAAQKAVITVPDNEEPIVSIYTDPEMQGTQAMLSIKRPATPLEINNTIYGETIETLHAYMSLMANARLQEIAMKPDAPFISAGMSLGSVGIIPTLEAASWMVNTKDGELLRGFEAMYTEMERIRRHGFTQSEFERAQENLMRYAEKDYANRNDRTNNDYVHTYLNNYQKNTPIADDETQWKIDSTLIKQLPVEAVNQYAQQVLYAENQVIVVNAPEKEGLKTPTEEELLAVRKKVIESEIAPHEDNVVKEPLIDPSIKLKGSPVQTTTKDELLGTTEWILKNGAKIILKPTNFKADELRMTAYAEGGLAMLKAEEHTAGELMSSITSMSGIGKFSATELKKQLSGKSVSVQPVFDNYSGGVSANCSPKDVETMLQLVYLSFTQPRFNQDDFNRLMTLLRTQLANIKSNPDYLMQEKVTDVIYGHNPLRQELTLESLDEVKFEQLPAIYHKLLPGVNGLTFVFAGNIDAETLRPLVEKYIGSLPTMKKPLTFVDDKVRFVEGVVKEDFKTPMQQPKVSVSYTFTGDTEFSIKNKLAINFLAQALNSRYLISIREEKGGTYGVGVGGTVNYYPKAQYMLRIMFDTNEKMADELMEIIMLELEKIAKEGPVSEDIEKHREFMLKSWQNTLVENGSWIRYLIDKETKGINSVAEFEQNIRKITCEDVQKMAQQILKDNNMAHIVMRPEAAAQADQAEK